MENKNNTFYKELILISLPITLQYFIGSSLNLIDTIMVGQLGDSVIAAVGIANQIFILLNMVLFGISGGCAIFASQFFGKKDYKSIKNIAGLGLIIGLSISIIYFILVHLFSDIIMGIFTKDIDVIIQGSKYLKLVSISYPLTAITIIVSSISRSTGYVKTPMIASILGIIINTTGNYLLIFGNFGFPELGVEGAAIATVIARSIEITVLISTIYIKKFTIASNIRELLGFSKILVIKFLNQTALLVLKDVVFILGITIYIIIYARIGTDAIAAVNIVNSVQNLALVFLSGIGQGALIMVGQKLGVADNETAYFYAKKFQKISIIIGVIIGVLIFLLKDLILYPFNLSKVAQINTHQLLTVLSISYLFIGYGMISVVGILRSGGDTMFCLKMDIIAVWLIGLPIALISGFVFKLSISWIVALTSIKDIYKMIVLRKRISSKKWMNNMTDGI